MPTQLKIVIPHVVFFLRFCDPTIVNGLRWLNKITSHFYALLNSMKQSLVLCHVCVLSFFYGIFVYMEQHHNQARS